MNKINPEHKLTIELSPCGTILRVGFETYYINVTIEGHTGTMLRDIIEQRIMAGGLDKPAYMILREQKREEKRLAAKWLANNPPTTPALIKQREAKAALDKLGIDLKGLKL